MVTRLGELQSTPAIEASIREVNARIAAQQDRGSGMQRVIDAANRSNFAQNVARGVTATKLYVSDGYSKAGASPSSARMLTNAMVKARIRELQSTIAQATIEASIREVNARVAAQQDRWERMQRVIDERAQDPDHLVAPGRLDGATGTYRRRRRLDGLTAAGVVPVGVTLRCATSATLILRKETLACLLSTIQCREEFLGTEGLRNKDDAEPRYPLQLRFST